MQLAGLSSGDYLEHNVNFVAGKGLGVGPGMPTVALTATSGGWRVTGTFASTAALIALTDGDATLAAAQHRAGLLSMATGAANRTITTLTAALLVAAYPGIQASNMVYLSMVNLKAANTVTMGLGVGVTGVGSLLVAAASSATFAVLFTDVGSGTEAVSLIRVAG